MKRNILALLIVLALAIFISGCSPKDNKAEENLPKDTVEEENEPIESEEAQSKDSSPDIAIGKLSPDLVYVNKDGEEVFLKDLDGKEVSLEDYRGKIVVLNFWATWCMYCDLEMPDLQKLDDENDDLVVIGVNVEESADIVKKYIDEGQYDFQLALDTGGDLARTYLVSGFPTTYFIDKEGILLGGVPRMLEYDEMISILDGIREDEK